MARRKLKIQETELKLQHAPGYAPDGVSGFSHALAKGHRVAVRNFRDRFPLHRLDSFIASERANVARLQRRLAEAVRAGDTAKIAIASVRLDKTSELLARLVAERSAS